MTGSQHFSPGDIQFQLVYDRGQCVESSHLNPIFCCALQVVCTTEYLDIHPLFYSAVCKPGAIELGTGVVSGKI